MSKKASKSIKEKRAEKRDKGSTDSLSDQVHPSKQK